MAILDVMLKLLSSICVVVVGVYAISRTRYFGEVLRRQFNFRNQLIFILFFGALSVYGTYSGTRLPSGPIVNIRDLSPMIAGLLGGPIIGLGAGLIGGVHRYFVGGMSALPCALATIIAGLSAGAIYKWQRGKFISIRGAAVFAIVIECLHSVLALLIIRPYDTAWAAVKSAGLPVLLADTAGIIIAAWMIKNLIQEKGGQGAQAAPAGVGPAGEDNISNKVQ